MSTTDPAPRILAIDMALEKSGLCYHEDGMEQPVTWTFDTGKLRGHEREDAIKAELDRVLTTRYPEVVLLEKLPPRITPGLIGLAYLHGIVRNHLSHYGPYVEVPLSHIKIYGCGKGNGPDSDKMHLMLAVDRRYPHLVTINDDNQADAFLLLALGRHAYGYPLLTVDDKKLPNTHLRVLDMLADWPAIGTHESPVGTTATTSRRSGRAKSKAAAA